MFFKSLAPPALLLAALLAMPPALKANPAQSDAITSAVIASEAMESEAMEAEGPPEPVSIYDRPYSLWENNVDKPTLRRNTLLLFGAGVGAMGVLYLMPSSFTNWEDDGESPFRKWWDNVSHAPVWDEDDWFLNYVTHPYAGAIYYMGARSAGAGAGVSFAYSFALSTFFWEYGIEAFAERPSIQDLIVTPVAGSLLGEGFYLIKRHLVENDYNLCDSRALGITVALLIDPISEIGDFLFGEDAEKHDVAFHGQPLISKDGKLGYYVSFSFTF